MRRPFGPLGVDDYRRLAAAIAAALASAAVLVSVIEPSRGRTRIVLLAGAALALVVVAVTEWRAITARRRAVDHRSRTWAERHFDPAGRGVSHTGDPGEHFNGRTDALRAVVTWLSGSEGMCVVTGDPGSGKSALLGRLVALADPARAHEVAGLPEGTVPWPGAIDAVILVRGLTLTDVVEAIAAHVGSAAVEPEDLVEAIVDRALPFALVVDELDEAVGDGEARRIAQKLLRPLAHSGAAVGVRVLVGTRRGPRQESSRELLYALGPHLEVDLDTEFFDEADLTDYVAERLRCDDRVAAAVARRAGRSFLVAQLVTAALRDTGAPIDTSRDGWELAFPDEVGRAMDEYLDRYDTEADRRRARALLTALAFAEGAGLPRTSNHGTDLWAAVAGALAERGLDSDDVDWLLGTPAADLLVEREEHGLRGWRLFHEALAEHLRGDDALARHRERTVAATLERTVPRRREEAGADWSLASDYVRLHLAAHAAAGGALDPLIVDPGYLTEADPASLLRALPAAVDPAALTSASVYRQVAHLLAAEEPAARASYLELSARRNGASWMGDLIAAAYPDRPWRTCWARWRALRPHVVLPERLFGASSLAVGAVDGRPVIVCGCAGEIQVRDLTTGMLAYDPLPRPQDAAPESLTELDGAQVIVAGGRNAEVRVWDLATGRLVASVSHEPRAAVCALAIAEDDAGPLIVQAHYDGSIRLRDIDTGAPLGAHRGAHAGAIHALAVAEREGRPTLISAGADGAVRVAALVSGTAAYDALRGHDGSVRSIAVGRLGGRAICASGGDDGTVRVWDLATGSTAGDQIHAHEDAVRSIAIGELDERPAIVSGGLDGTVRVHDAITATSLREPFGPADQSKVAFATVDRRPVVVSADEEIRVWELAPPAAELDPGPGPSARAMVVCEREAGPAIVWASADLPGTVHASDVATGEEWYPPLAGHARFVDAVAVAAVDGREVIVSGGADGLLRWDLAAGARMEPVPGDEEPITNLAVASADGRPVLIDLRRASTRLQARDFATGAAVSAALGVREQIDALAVAVTPGRPPLAVAGLLDGTMAVWDLASGMPAYPPIPAHERGVHAVAVGMLDDRAVIVSTGWDSTLRIWDLETGAPVGEPRPCRDADMTVAIGGHGARTWIAAASETLRIWDATGEERLAIRLGTFMPAMAVCGTRIVLGGTEGLVCIEPTW